MSKKETHFIVLRESIAQSWARDAGTFSLFAGLISLGVYVESGAMQWVGAIIGFMVVISRAAGFTKRSEMTREQAIKFLQEMPQ